MKRFIFVIVGTIAATSEAALADQLHRTPEPSKPNPQLTKPVSISGESPQLPKIDEKIEILQVELLKLEASQQLPSDRLINRTLRLEGL